MTDSPTDDAIVRHSDGKPVQLGSRGTPATSLSNVPVCCQGTEDNEAPVPDAFRSPDDDEALEPEALNLNDNPETAVEANETASDVLGE